MMDAEKAIKTALNMLSVRMYTCREVYDRLLRKGYDTQTAENAIAEISKLGLLDDREYARLYFHDAITLSAKGVFRIKQELIKKGVARSIIDEAAEECEVSTEENLLRYAEERLTVRPVKSYRELERFKAQLARRGYTPSEIFDCLNHFSFDFSDE